MSGLSRSSKSKKIAVITVGTRGSVESVLALSLGLRAAGYSVKMCAGRNLESYVRDHGFEYSEVDDGVMRLADANEVLEGSAGSRLGRGLATSVRFVRNFRASVDRMVRSAWAGVQGADAVVYRPHGTGGHRLAQLLGVPSFLVEPAPFVTPTAEFPSLVMPHLPLGRWYNRASYSMLAALTAPLHRAIVSSARQLSSDNGHRGRRAEAHPIVLNNFSPEVLKPPADWPSWARATGWLFVPTPESWHPPDDLVRFLEAGHPPIYLGFGSMSRNPRETTSKVLAAMRATGYRFVLSTGWGGLDPSDVPEGVFVVRSVPHEWLFPRVAAVVHHGGAGTVGRGLHAGKATVGCPFFGDQVFWSDVVHRIGVGPRPIPQHKLTTERLVEAIRIVMSDGEMRERARRLGEKLEREDGVARSIEIIEEQLARSERAVG